MTAASENHPKHSYSPIRHNGLEVPETEIHLDNSPQGPNEPFRVYRTRGPQCAPEEGLPALRSEWISERGDTEEYTGRGRELADDGRAAQRRGASSQEWKGAKRSPLKAQPKRRITQMHYARQGVITREMEFVALRSGIRPC